MDGYLKIKEGKVEWGYSEDLGFAYRLSEIKDKIKNNKDGFYYVNALIEYGYVSQVILKESLIVVPIVFIKNKLIDCVFNLVDKIEETFL